MTTSTRKKNVKQTEATAEVAPTETSVEVTEEIAVIANSDVSSETIEETTTEETVVETANETTTDHPKNTRSRAAFDRRAERAVFYTEAAQAAFNALEGEDKEVEAQAFMTALREVVKAYKPAPKVRPQTTVDNTEVVASVIGVTKSKAKTRFVNIGGASVDIFSLFTLPTDSPIADPAKKFITDHGITMVGNPNWGGKIYKIEQLKNISVNN